jgi:ectoine hydroxylase-related dioxygenase (phytanoyl-CoA dioxygenase family)
VGADDLKWISGYVSIKEASSRALWWHQDWWCWDHSVSYRREAPQIAALCYLADTDAHNGGLRLLPGSHQRSAPIHASLPEAHSQTAETLEAGHVAMTDLPDQLTPGMRAGDAVAIDYRLLHGTHGNASSTRRDCILLSFTPSWRRLPEDIKAHLIDHPALPLNEASPIPAAISRLLPAFAGKRRSLPLNRNAPREFAISDSDVT